MRPRLLALACAAALGCGLPAPFAERNPEPTRVPGNLLTNPGFEAGREGWSIMAGSPVWGDFEIVDSPVRSGRRAAHLSLRAGRDTPPDPVKVFGVVQELRPERFPDRVSGWYRVESWEKGADVTHLYLQFVAIVWGDPETPRMVDPESPNPRMRNFQLRYYLAGVREPPFLLSNARLVFVTKELPVRGRWARFEVPLRRDVEQLWGKVPTDYEFLRVLFEARWDNKPAGSRIHADAYYDDLFVGYAEDRVD